jgi:hypothetical protein
VTAAPGGSGHRGRSNLKLLRRIDGGARLLTPDAEVEVRCAAGEYEERTRTTITGALEADLSRFSDADEATLRLPDGVEVSIRLIEPDGEGADFRSV